MDATPASLLERIRHRPTAGDWDRFVHLFTPLLSRWAYRLGVPSSETEDALQDVFVLLFQKLPAFRRDPAGSFRAWLWTVFRHELIARLRRNRGPAANGSAPLETVAADTPDFTDDEYRRHLVSRALQLVQRDFPGSTWQVFWAVAVDGQPVADVAKRFGVTANSVYLTRGRVLARLRAELAGFDAI